MKRFFPSTFRRLGASSSRSNLSSLGPVKPPTASSMLQRATGKAYTPKQMEKTVHALSAHPERGTTAQERTFLRAYQQRKKLGAAEVKTAAKGLYQVAEEEGLNLKYVAGTVTEKSARLAKQEAQAHTPPPVPVQPGPRPIDLIRQRLHIQHGGLSAPAPSLPSMQEPTPLPKTESWKKGSSVPTSNAPAPKTPHLSPLQGGFTYGHSTNPNDQPDQPPNMTPPSSAEPSSRPDQTAGQDNVPPPAPPLPPVAHHENTAPSTSPHSDPIPDTSHVDEGLPL